VLAGSLLLSEVFLLEIQAPSCWSVIWPDVTRKKYENGNEKMENFVRITKRE
jgi:hypothetical protein